MKSLRISLFVAQAVRLLSLLALVIILLTNYQKMPNILEIKWDSSTKSEIGRLKFFYLSAGIILIINILVVLLNDLFKKLPTQSLPSWLVKTTSRTDLNEAFTEWCYWGLTLQNIMLGLLIYAVTSVNIPDTQTTFHSFRWTAWVASAFLIFWVGYAPARLLFGNEPRK